MSDDKLRLGGMALRNGLALFGPTDPQRNGPYRDRRGVVASMGRVADEEVLERALAVSR